MYSNMLDRLNKQKDDIESMIKQYQNAQQPINNFFSSNQTPSKTLVEWRILNENEEVDNLYVQNKTLFINETAMILKGVDGSLEKWEIKKVYPIDKKDQKISELEEEIKKLKEMINNEHSKSNSTIGEFEQPNDYVNEPIEPKPKTNSKYISKQK